MCKRFTNLFFHWMEQMFESGTDPDYEDNVLGETYSNLSAIFAHSNSSDEKCLGLETGAYYLKYVKHYQQLTYY